MEALVGKFTPRRALISASCCRGGEIECVESALSALPRLTGDEDRIGDLEMGSPPHLDADLALEASRGTMRLVTTDDILDLHGEGSDILDLLGTLCSVSDILTPATLCIV